MLGNPLAGAKPVLDGQHQRVIPHMCGYQFGRICYPVCLCCDYIQIARRDIVKRCGGGNAGYGSVAACAFQSEP